MATTQGITQSKSNVIGLYVMRHCKAAWKLVHRILLTKTNFFVKILIKKN